MQHSVQISSRIGHTSDSDSLIACPIPVTKAEALREYKRHGWTRDDLIADCGDKPSYTSREILLALGY